MMKTNKLNFLFLLLGGITLLLAQKVRAQETKNLPEFNKLRASGTCRIELIKSEKESYNYDNSIAGRTDIDIDGKTLVIKGKSSGNETPVKIYFRELQAIQCTDMVRINSADTIRGEVLHIMSDGVAKVNIIAVTNKIKIEADGASNVEISGSTKMLEADADGTASIKCHKLYTKDLLANADGIALIRARASENIEARADGASKIRYVGNPKIKLIEKDGMASIKADDDGDALVIERLQDEDIEENDTVHLKIGKRKYMIIHDEDEDEETRNDNPRKKCDMKSVWGGVELGVNGLVTKDMNFNMQPGYADLNTHFGRSWFIGVNLPELDGHVIRNKVAITTGFGLKWTWMEFKSNNIMRPDTSQLVFIASGNKLQENELNNFNLTVPVLLKFAPGNKKSCHKGVHLAAGVIVNYVATARLKIVTSDDGYEKTTHYESDFNLNPFRVDATVRFGYNWLRLFANYSLTPVFDSNRAPDIRTFSAGMTLIGF